MSYGEYWQQLVVIVRVIVVVIFIVFVLWLDFLFEFAVYNETADNCLSDVTRDCAHITHRSETVRKMNSTFYVQYRRMVVYSNHQNTGPFSTKLRHHDGQSDDGRLKGTMMLSQARTSIAIYSNTRCIEFSREVERFIANKWWNANGVPPRKCVLLVMTPEHTT